MKVLSILLGLLLAISVQAKQINLNSNNMVVIGSEINDASIAEAQLELVKQVAKRGTAKYTIYLVIDSGGGSIDPGLNFIEFAKTIPNLETVTLFAASMASAIVQQLPGRRYITESGISMFHRARGGVEGQFEDGELESRLDLYKVMVRSMEQKNADRLKMTLANYKAAVKDELWILGKDAVKRGAADEIVSVTCSADLTSKTITKTVQIFVFTLKVDFNACPMIKGGTVQTPEQQNMYNNHNKTVRMGH